MELTDEKLLTNYDIANRSLMSIFFSNKNISDLLIDFMGLINNVLNIDYIHIFERKDGQIFSKYIFDVKSRKRITKSNNEDVFSFDFSVDQIKNKVSIERMYDGSKIIIKSFAYFPLMNNSRHSISFEKLNYTKKWTDEDILFLQNFSLYFTQLILHYEEDEKLKITNESLELILDNIKDSIYVIESKTKKLIFANKIYREKYKDRYSVGKYCYEVARPDLKGVCHFCHHGYLNEVCRSISFDLYNEPTKQWLELDNSLITWSDGQKAILVVSTDITKRKELEEEQKEINEINNFILKNVNSFIWILNPKTHVFSATENITELLGYEPNYFENNSYNYQKHIYKDDVAKFNKAYSDYILHKKGLLSVDYRMVTSKGEIIWLHTRGVYRAESNSIYGMSMSIDGRKRQEGITLLALEAGNGYFWEMNPKNNTMKIFNKNTQDEKEVFQLVDLDEYFSKLNHLDYEEFKSRITDYIEGKTPQYEFDYYMFDENKNKKWIHASGKFLDNNKQIIYGISTDVTKQKENELKLAERVYKDTLTGLNNLSYLMDGLLKFNSNVKSIGAFVLDICRFKNINEAYGHEFGDKILVYIVEILKEQFNKNHIIRVVGDRFMVFFENIKKVQLENKMNDLFKALNKSIVINTLNIVLNIKIGAIYSSEIINPNELLKRCEIALNYAKDLNRINYYFYEEEVMKQIENTLSMEQQIYEGIRNNEFFLVYQPKVDIKKKEVIGVEALIRWKKADGKIVPPLDFIPFAEKTGQIHELGEYVLKLAFNEMKKFINKNNEFSIAVNVSAKQILASGFIEIIKTQCKKNQIPYKNVIIEITESVMISNYEYVLNVLSDLKSYGFKISLDDFGTGYSSLNYLTKMPINHLKIDKTFIDDCISDNVKQGVLKYIISLAHSLGYEVIAEGVEEKEQVNFLNEINCDVIQGYYFSKPINLSNLEDFLINWKFED